MAAKTTFLENRVLDRVLKANGQLSYSWPATVYAALFTSDPGLTGSITGEPVTANGYARVPVTWGTIASGSVSNSAAVSFAACTNSAWGTLTHVGIMDDATLLGGNVLYYGALGTSKTVGVGDAVSFAINALTITET